MTVAVPTKQGKDAIDGSTIYFKCTRLYSKAAMKKFGVPEPFAVSTDQRLFVAWGRNLPWISERAFHLSPLMLCGC
jgi:hypothetical protein